MANLDIVHDQDQLADKSPVAIARLTGVIDGTTLPRLESEIARLRDAGMANVVLVLGGITYINSTGMGYLIKCADMFRGAGGDIKLVEVPDKVQLLFRMLGLTAIFEFYAGLPAALETFGKTRTEAPPALAYPVRVTCVSCRNPIKITAAGACRCPHCRIYYKADSDCGVKAYRAVETRTLEIILPFDRALADGLGTLVRRFGEAIGMNGGREEHLAGAVRLATEMLCEAAPPSDGTMHWFLAGDRNGWLAGVATSPHDARTPTEIQAHPAYSRLEQTAGRVETVSLPRTGLLLKFSSGAGR
ncbi:MAG: STAS domain-containing protein [Planctomycetota bacterium]